jgi:hypothetical protein
MCNLVVFIYAWIEPLLYVCRGESTANPLQQIELLLIRIRQYDGIVAVWRRVQQAQKHQCVRLIGLAT